MQHDNQSYKLYNSTKLTKNTIDFNRIFLNVPSTQIKSSKKLKSATDSFHFHFPLRKLFLLRSCNATSTTLNHYISNQFEYSIRKNVIAKKLCSTNIWPLLQTHDTKYYEHRQNLSGQKCHPILPCRSVFRQCWAHKEPSCWK